MAKDFFREDRDFNFDAPGNDATTREKLEHQRKPRKACEFNHERPFDSPWTNPFDPRWWCQVEGISPEQEEYQRRQYEERAMKRFKRPNVS